MKAHIEKEITTTEVEATNTMSADSSEINVTSNDKLPIVNELINEIELPAWLSVDDIAKEPNIHPDTVRSWRRDRKLKATKLGRDYRIKRVGLDKFLDDRTINPDSN